MRRSSLLLALALALAALTRQASAQQPTLPPIRPLGPTVAVAGDSLVNVVGVRALATGGVLVNDAGARTVLLLDSLLANPRVVADSTSATANAYGGRFGGLVAFRGDSSLFVDPASMSMLVIDAGGKVARVMSVPNAQDAMAFAGGPLGSASFDPAGRLVYRGGFGFRTMRTRTAAGPGASGPMAPPEMPDSAPIARVDLASRHVDTVAYFKIPKTTFRVQQRDDNTMQMTSEVNPLPVVDDWAVLPDGSIAIVRGSDYHVDWIAPDGSMRSTPKIPFEWQRLSDEDKVAFIDSVKAIRARMQASGTEAGAGAAAGGGAPIGQQVIVMRTAPGPGGGAPPGPPTHAPEVTFVAPDQLPDYKPPFFAGAVRADTDGNLWVRTIPTRAIPGGPVYDVIDREGRLTERVQVPAGRSIIGFGPNGAVYLLARENGKLSLEKARVR